MKCVDCGVVTYNEYLCTKCFNKRLKKKIAGDARKVNIEHPSNKYF